MLLTSYIVDTPFDDPSAGQSDTDGFISLREAITAANSDDLFGDAPAGEGGGIVDTITFAESLIDQTIVLGGVELAVRGDLSITGLGADKLTISGDNASGVFWIAPDVTVDISHVTIADGDETEGAGVCNEGTLTVTSSVLTNNSSGSGGGAVYNDAGALTIIDTTLSNNYAYVRGGGVWNTGTLDIRNSTFRNNATDANGGGIANREGGTVTITGSTFEGNSGRSGGAIDNYDWYAGPQGTLLISESTFKENSSRGSGGVIFSSGVTKIAQSTFSDNSAGSWGGGIFMWGGAVDISDSTLSGNHAGREAGAVENWGGTLKITNSTLSGNSCDGPGGAVYNYGTLMITSSTLVLNQADADGNGAGSGGGLYLYSTSRYSDPILHNSILAGNTVGASGSDSPEDIFGAVDPASSHNLIGDAATAGGLADAINGNIVGNGGSGTIDVATVLDTNLANNGGATLTHALVRGGLAMNAGDNSKAVDGDGNALAYDQRGESFGRISAGIVDIGAFEVQPSIDVKPGSDRNPINLAGNGVIAVAIFTTEEFDASQVDADSVVFAGASALHSALEDIDGDGDLDMVLHFRVQETNLLDMYAELLAEDMNEDGVLDSKRHTAAVSLTGQTGTDEHFEAFDEVDLFLAGKNLRDFLEGLAAAGAI